MKTFLKICLIVFALSGCFKDLKQIVVQTQSKDVVYNVEVADTLKKLQKGLMFRNHLPSNQGMLFLFDNQHLQPVAMWMKNTYISLDMLFIGKNKTIVAIVQNTEPLSLKIISPTREYVSAVLELNAGEVKKHAIQVGDKVLY
ncbi:MAG: DUF192 domain-containing protein [Alphaproteobacteria bacterium]|nr:DUF192 domain-containing protein [Alphaproteobacteria bacterium]